MSAPNSMRVASVHPRWIIGICLLLAVGVAAVFHSAWLPTVQSLAASLAHVNGSSQAAGGHDHEHDHGHEHGHEHGHDDADSLQISPQARKNIALKTGPVALTEFERTISVPGVVVERPGLSVIAITAPMTGIVTRIGVIQGEAVAPGQFLFEMRLTHEDLVQAQSEFLKTAEELDVIGREIQRLDKVTASGGIPGKTLLERKYEQQKQQAVLHAQHQSLLLHGLSEEQVKEIQASRTLIKELQIVVPTTEKMAELDAKAVYQVTELKVERGRQVTAGEMLAVLTNHAELFIEGNAFEKDVPLINRALERDAAITAVVDSGAEQKETLEKLKILYLAGSVDVESRAFHFYATLPNERLRDQPSGGRRFISWRYKPGQRVQLLVPVEQWKDRIVLPAEAVAQDGVEAYVFQANGDRFQRRPVHIEYRDPYSVVIANDGSVFPGDVVALSSAQQMLLAIKNKSGSAIDPHAGHNH